MKKSISVVLVLSIIAGLFAMCGVTAFAEDDILDYITYKIDNGEVAITGCDPSISGDVVIPDTIEGYPVTVIDAAFNGCENITSVTIPDSVLFMTECAFCNCVNLKTIDLGNGITQLDQLVFINCISLKSVKIPDSVKEIGHTTFYNCSGLESVEIGKNLKTIADDVFLGCASLKRITVDEENQYYSNDEHGVLFNKDKTELLYYPAGKTESLYIVPEGVISVYGFDFCSNLKSVEFPASVTQVNTIFEGTQLEKITFYNKNCIIGFEEYSIPETAVIYGYKGSVAESYANAYKRKFVSLDDNTDATDNDAFSAFIRFFDSFVHLIKTLFNQLLNMFSFK